MLNKKTSLDEINWANDSLNNYVGRLIDFNIKLDDSTKTVMGIKPLIEIKL